MPSTWTKDPREWRTGPPPPCQKTNWEGCAKYKGFVDEAVAKLLNTGVTKIFPEKEAHRILGMTVHDKGCGEKIALSDQR